MTIRELKSILSKRALNDDMFVSICIDTPGGFMCPDGASCDVLKADYGIDWHDNELLIVPKYKLKLANDGDIEKWQYRK